MRYGVFNLDDKKRPFRINRNFTRGAVDQPDIVHPRVIAANRAKIARLARSAQSYIYIDIHGRRTVRMRQK
ncbi:MAG: hypothetical protein D6706_06670 [Chloroflexi bacterium]|nr:MAG: hypothetical protein D6706_06670 [Chloroflexota bacterium]